MYTSLAIRSTPILSFIHMLMGMLLLSGMIGCEESNKPNSDITCRPVYGLDTLLSPGSVLLLGELHGTQEAPAYMYDMACNALAKGLSVTVALELPHADQSAFEDFLESDGSLASAQIILALPFWSREFQDGRASQAMLELVDKLRSAKQQGGKLEVLLIDEPKSEDRDLAMSQYILTEAQANPTHMLLALTGNYHNMIHEGSGRMGYYVLQELGAKRVCSLNQSYRIGSAWVATAGREPGPNLLRGDGMEGVGIMMGTPMLEYHGTFEMDSIHYSPPAKQSL